MSASSPEGPATETGAQIDAFLASTEAGGIEYIAPADVRTVLERFAATCAEAGRAPGELTPETLSRVLERLPRRYPTGDPLGQRTVDVLRTFLAFLAPHLPPERARGLVRALEAGAEPFRAKVRGEPGGPGALEPADAPR